MKPEKTKKQMYEERDAKMFGGSLHFCVGSKFALRKPRIILMFYSNLDWYEGFCANDIDEY